MEGKPLAGCIPLPSPNRKPGAWEVQGVDRAILPIRDEYWQSYLQMDLQSGKRVQWNPTIWDIFRRSYPQLCGCRRGSEAFTTSLQGLIRPAERV